MQTRKRLLGSRRGSITVFLSLSGILIIALLGTLVETARYTACGNHTVRTIRTSAEALLTEYSRPLYDHYGLFFLEDTGIPFEKVIAGYASDTMESALAGTMDFLKGEIHQVSVADKTYVGDQEAAPLQQEIRGLMGRRITGDQLKKWLKRSSDAGDSDKKAEEIEETVENQREMAELDKQLLKLMKWIDGITVSNGKISCAGEFVKMFAVKEKKSQYFGVNESAVWKKMKEHLDDSPRHWRQMDRKSFLAKIKKVIKLTDQAIKEEGQLERAYNRCRGKNREFADHDKKMQQLIRQMSVLRGNRHILTETEKLLKEPLKEEGADLLDQLWKDYDTESICFDYTGVEEQGGADHPLEALSTVWGDGILNLVIRDPKKLSGASVAKADESAMLYREQGETDEDYGERISELTEKEKVSLSGAAGDLVKYGMDHFFLDRYIQDKFSSYEKTVSGWKRALKYQWEYIVAGRSSDKKNLEAVLNRILMIRTPVNFAAIYKDAAKKQQAYAAAAAVVGFTGMEPLIRFTQTMILVVWSIVEALVDVAGILQGRDVPLLKKSSQILTSFPQIFQLTGKAITKRAGRFAAAGKKSFGYKDYLLLFLGMKERKKKLYRVMDLIQWDMNKNGYERFRLDRCVFSIKVSASIVFPARFFHMPVIGAMLGRDIRDYSYACEIEKGYL